MNQREARHRLIADAFISPEECRALIQLVERHGPVGDGYRGNPHPHTASEIFHGYSLDGLHNSTQQVLPGHREALLVMQKVRRKLKAHFGLPVLWLEFGHLVYRQPNPATPAENVEAFSHPWHYDNQTSQRRTHTAILYLNNEFEGGLTRFKETEFGPYREVQPQPGRVVAFEVAHNPHAVSKLVQGKRYVLNMWFSTHWRTLNRHRQIFAPLWFGKS